MFSQNVETAVIIEWKFTIKVYDLCPNQLSLNNFGYDGEIEG